MRTNKMTDIEREKRKLIDRFEIKTHHFAKQSRADLRSGYIMGLNDALALSKEHEPFEWGDGDMRVGV